MVETFPPNEPSGSASEMAIALEFYKQGDDMAKRGKLEFGVLKIKEAANRYLIIAR